MTFVPIYILILAITIIIDYFAGIYIEQSAGKKRKLFLVFSLIANIGVLAIFKYYNFLNDNLSALLGSFDISNPVPYISILLPIGLSFHTFQAMSYTIEVYRGNQKAERHFGIYSLYVLFYPQLVAGPIERPQNIIHQLREKYDFEYVRVSEGLKQMAWGFSKKLIIADRLSIYVDAVYNNPDQHTGNSLVLATVFFAVQIYCDFSGYSDIAIGAARVMGFDLMTNFNRPYFSKNIAEFWKRWHISLSTWFRDYLYIPLGGNKVAVPRWFFNLFIVFLISGLWHGANWTYLIWGGLNGFYLIFAIVTQKYRDAFSRAIRLIKLPRLNTFIQILITFILVCFTWIFFRANSVHDAFFIIQKMFSTRGPIFIESPSMLIFALVGISLLFIVEFRWEYFPKSFSPMKSKFRFVRNLSYAFLVILILLIGVFDGGQFIYFQF
jgi:D-alanyl-lipoteichoic acid acyltransferase DltB (MBOAT superfamily)